MIQKLVVKVYGSKLKSKESYSVFKRLFWRQKLKELLILIAIPIIYILLIELPAYIIVYDYEAALKSPVNKDLEVLVGLGEGIKVIDSRIVSPKLKKKISNYIENRYKSRMVSISKENLHENNITELYT